MAVAADGDPGGAASDRLEQLLDAVRRLHAGEDGPLRYRVLEKFKLGKLDLEGFDLVLRRQQLLDLGPAQAREHLRHVTRHAYLLR